MWVHVFILLFVPVFPHEGTSPSIDVNTGGYLTKPHHSGHGNVTRPGDATREYHTPTYGYGLRGSMDYPGLQFNNGLYPSPSFGSGGESPSIRKKRGGPVNPGNFYTTPQDPINPTLPNRFN